MKHKLQRLFHDIACKIGLYVLPNNLNTNHAERLVNFLNYHNVNTILDAGANRGQYALRLLKGGFKGQIISFEALPHVYDELVQIAKPYGRSWVIAPRCALSDEEGQVEFYVSKNSQCSSLLKPNTQTKGITGLDTKEIVKVKTLKLDTLVNKMDIDVKNSFLKLDVQGAEKKVLSGAENVITQICGLQAELGLRPMYDKQTEAQEIHDYITKKGFDLWDILPGSREPKTARLVEYDGIYFTKKK